MPKWTFTLPDGSKRTVTTPDGYTKEQAWGFAQHAPAEPFRREVPLGARAHER